MEPAAPPQLPTVVHDPFGRSTKRYSTLAVQFCANPSSSPAPTVQPADDAGAFVAGTSAGAAEAPAGAAICRIGGSDVVPITTISGSVVAPWIWPWFWTWLWLCCAKAACGMNSATIPTAVSNGHRNIGRPASPRTPRSIAPSRRIPQLAQSRGRILPPFEPDRQGRFCQCPGRSGNQRAPAAFIRLRGATASRVSSALLLSLIQVGDRFRVSAGGGSGTAKQFSPLPIRINCQLLAAGAEEVKLRPPRPTTTAQHYF
jgi:hypothetical protein